MLFKSSKQRKAQSAMEYLMTYGWAILIIAVVLGALFSLGVFSGANLLGNACIASSGYLCQNPTYLHGSGGVLVTLGQNTGATWTSANFIFVPQGTSITAGGLPTTLSQGVISVSGNTPGGNVLVTGSLNSGQQATLWLPVNGVTPPVTVGTPATGAVWVQYQTTSTGPFQYAQLASINIKAS